MFHVLKVLFTVLFMVFHLPAIVFNGFSIALHGLPSIPCLKTPPGQEERVALPQQHLQALPVRQPGGGAWRQLRAAIPGVGDGIGPQRRGTDEGGEEDEPHPCRHVMYDLIMYKNILYYIIYTILYY